LVHISQFPIPSRSPKLHLSLSRHVRIRRHSAVHWQLLSGRESGVRILWYAAVTPAHCLSVKRARTGSIFRATHIHTGELVALKVQHVNHECPTNRYERHLYPSLQGTRIVFPVPFRVKLSCFTRRRGHADALGVWCRGSLAPHTFFHTLRRQSFPRVLGII
jgi:hypothetical protein